MNAVEPLVGFNIHVGGIVQGVGFRPFIYDLAIRNHLTGWVRNTSQGVEIEINGNAEAIGLFINELKKNPPPLARIDQFTSQSCKVDYYSDFEIITSQLKPGEFIPVSPDVAICPDCQKELFDPDNRRFRYPFINCTNCGPRFTIVRDIPYDRPKTTMADFPLCPDCKAEYDNPLDRRFHAQPVACPKCGPQVWLETNISRIADGENAIQIARTWLRDGKILAIKGLGGYHLACDAANTSAVEAIRSRKKRSDKPFALMAFDIDTVERYCWVSPEERLALSNRQKPIVLLDRLSGTKVVSRVALGVKTLGIMLAYTPLHLLLLEPEQDFPDLLVMTSGNMSEEPIAYIDLDARQRLGGIADGYLLHNRPIHMRVDDSVIRIINRKVYPLRRARGYAPDPITLPNSVPQILATGAELKNTFCLTRDSYAFLSHHIGDMENYETLQSFEEGIQHYEKLFRITPEAIACDLHPNYLASRYARQHAEQEGIPLFEIQHHHAHLAACLADAGWTSSDPVIGICFDGTGMGTDGAIWGGEILLGGYRNYQRRYRLSYAPLPGGDMAIRKPARMALAYLWQFDLEWEPTLPPVQALCPEERTTLLTQLEHQFNTIPTSSMGRLFDAVSAIMGICQDATYEGQAAIELEACASSDEDGYYTIEISDGEMNPTPLLRRLITDLRAGTPKPKMAARFHNGIAQAVLDVCRQIRADTDTQVVALSGGVWQNRYLLERSVNHLEQGGFQVLLHQRVPANDGGISLGQALIAGYTIQDKQQ
jgi:hydrogenase maturation protein HypF